MSLLPPQFHDSVPLKLGKKLKNPEPGPAPQIEQIRPGILRVNGKLQTNFPENEKARYFFGDPVKLQKALDALEKEFQEMFNTRIFPYTRT